MLELTRQFWVFYPVPGGGAIIYMPLAGPLTARFGCRKIIGCAAIDYSCYPCRFNISQ